MAACVLFSARDESQPKSVDKNRLLKRFLVALKGQGAGGVAQKLESLSVGESDKKRDPSERWSAVIEGAGHTVEEPQAMQELLSRIVGFVKAVSRS